MSKMQQILTYLKNYDSKPVKLMEVCGTHTSAIAKSGIRSLLSPKIQLCSGPGCPVCVTPKAYIDKLCEYAEAPDTVVATFGDMIRVPGSQLSLAEVKARGGKIEIFYSPFEMIQKAIDHKEITYIIAAVGFETTTPLYALMIDQLIERGITNIKFLTALKGMIPILEVLCTSEHTLDGFIAPGHVSAIIGSDAYSLLASHFHKPFAVAGFSPEEVILSIYDLIKQIECDKHEVHNLYPEVVKPLGNLKAQRLIEKYFKTAHTHWRGIGEVEGSGLYLRAEYKNFDADSQLSISEEKVPLDCKCQEVIRGRIQSSECKLFGTSCTPEHPVGPCMISGEGACGIWFREGGKAC